MAAIVVYYSRKGQNYWAGSIRNLDKGNTERVAEFVAEATDADLFEVQTVDDYPVDYYACTDVAKAELRDHARPEVAEVPDVSAYDTIFLGYPNWWGTMPMCLYTVVEAWAARGGLEGKTICPFCTNEGSGLGGSVRELRKIAAGARIEEGLSITGNQAAQAKAQATRWARQFA